MEDNRNKITRRIIALSVLLLAVFLFISHQGVAKESHTKDETAKQTEVVAGNHSQENHEHAEEGSNSEHTEHSNMLPLFFVIIALFIGTATRHFLRKSPLPYTVTLLFLGILLGALARIGFFDAWHIGDIKINMDFISNSIKWAGTIDPHLIMYVFLPTLIFEAAFAMDVHTFKKSFGNAFIL